MSGYSVHAKNESIAHRMMRIASYGDAPSLLYFITKGLYNISDPSNTEKNCKSLTQIAQNMANKLANACPFYVANKKSWGPNNKAKLITSIVSVFEKYQHLPPYDLVGKTLTAFSAWRQECRITCRSNPYYDTKNSGVQHAAQEALVALCLTQLKCQTKDKVYQELGQEHKKGHVDKKAHIEIPYPIEWSDKSNNPLTRTAFFDRSMQFRKALSGKDPLHVLNHVVLHHSIGSQGYVNGRHVPDVFTLTHIALTEPDWNKNRLFVMHTIQTKNVVPRHRLPHINICTSSQTYQVVHNEKVDEEKYNSWWIAHKKSAAKVWRIIRRQRNMSTNKIEELVDAPIGDIVTRLKELGPKEIVDGVLSKFDMKVKVALLNRVNPALIPLYKTCMAVQETIGPITEHITEQLTNHWPTNKKSPSLLTTDSIDVTLLI